MRSGCVGRERTAWAVILAMPVDFKATTARALGGATSALTCWSRSRWNWQIGEPASTPSPTRLSAGHDRGRGRERGVGQPADHPAVHVDGGLDRLVADASLDLWHLCAGGDEDRDVHAPQPVGRRRLAGSLPEARVLEESRPRVAQEGVLVPQSAATIGQDKVAGCTVNGAPRYGRCRGGQEPDAAEGGLALGLVGDEHLPVVDNLEGLDDGYPDGVADLLHR